MLFEKSSYVPVSFFILDYIGGINDGQGSFVGPILFLISAFLGVLVTVFFPLDAGGEIITLRGKMHLGLEITSGLLTITGMVALWFRLALVDGWSIFATFSLISAIVSFILVIISVIFMKSNYRGLAERLTVTPYQLYCFVISLTVFMTN